MPLGFDFSLEKLKEYRGINPKPADFDAYWDTAIDEMQALDDEVELIPSDFQVDGAECFDLYFTGIGGARVHAKYLRPKEQTEPHPAVLMFHGYTGSSGDWHDKLGYVFQGYSVAALDCRGQGGLSEDVGGVGGNTHNGHIIRGLSDALNGKPESLLYRQIFLDTAQLAKIVMNFPEVDPDRLGATGGSQGGALTVACIALEPRIKLAAPVFPFLSDYKRVWEMDEDKAAYEELRTYFRHFDPNHDQEDQIFEMLGYIDIHNLAPRIKSKVLWFIGFMDEICPPSTQFAAYNQITSEKEMVIYPDFGHEGLPGSGDKILQFFRNL